MSLVISFKPGHLKGGHDVDLKHTIVCQLLPHGIFSLYTMLIVFAILKQKTFIFFIKNHSAIAFIP